MEMLVILLVFVAAGVVYFEKKRPAEKKWKPFKQGWKSFRGRKKNDEGDDDENDESVAQFEIAEFRAHVTRKEYLMTYTESMFFRGLQAYAGERGRTVFSKVRLIDLVTLDPKYYRKKKIFQKLVSKHIDFVIADEKGRILRCVELDDYRHETENRNDAIKNEVMSACGVPLVRVKVAREYDYGELFPSLG